MSCSTHSYNFTNLSKIQIQIYFVELVPENEVQFTCKYHQTMLLPVVYENKRYQ